MNEVSVNHVMVNSEPAPPEDFEGGNGPDRDTELFGAASAGLGVLSFFTLLRLGNGRERSPLRTLAVWLAATAEANGATVLGALAIKKNRATGVPSRGLLLAAVGVVLGSFSLVLDLNFLRTRRRV